MGNYVPTQFYAGNGGGGTGDVVVYTVPAGMTAIVTDVSSNPSSNTANYLYLNSGETKLMYNTPNDPYLNIYRYKGFWVVPGGQSMMQATFTGGSQFTQFSGLLGSGDISGRTPEKLGTVYHTNGADAQIAVGGSNGCILKMVNVCNTTGDYRTWGLRHGGTPILPWSGNLQLQPYECRNYAFSVYVAPGSDIKSNAMDGLTGINATAHGWRL